MVNWFFQVLAVIFIRKLTGIVTLSNLPRNSSPIKENFLSLHLMKRSKRDRNLQNNTVILSSRTLKSDSHLLKKLFYLLQWKSFKNDEKCFLFHLKNSFCSQDIYAFVLNFWSCRKNGLIRKIRLISNETTTWLTNNYNTHIDQYLTK